MSKSIKKLIASAIIFIALFACTLFAKQNPAFITEFFTPFSKWLTGVLSSVCALVPFSVGEVMIFAAIVFALILIVKLACKKIKFMALLSTVVFTLSLIFAYFYFSWGFNYYAEPLSQSINLEVKKFSPQELYNAALYFANKANSLSLKTKRTTENVFLGESFEIINQKVKEGYENLSKEYPFYIGKYPPAKTFLSSGIFVRFDITGMYTPYSGEANVVSKTPPLSMPFTVAHEYAHRLGIAPEEEANFSAFLACIYSEDVNLSYSAYYMAYVYCHNALPREYRAKLNATLTPNLINDINYISNYYKQFESPANKIGTKVNDTYLKVMNQQEGVKSYGLVVDLLISYYQQIV